MSLGILNNVSAIYAENNLNNTQSSLQTVLQQLSSGARINSGADDAAGLAIANGLKANENALTQSAQNASDGIGLLSTADGALSQVTNLLDRAVTLATEAANGTLSSAQVSSANQEYQSIITEIGNIGSTTNFNGNNVFSGTSTTFYVGDGTSSGSNVYNDVTGALSVNSVGQAAPSTGGVAATLALATNATNTFPTTSTGATTLVQGVSTTTAASATFAFTSANDTVSGTLGWNEVGETTPGASITFAAGTTLTAARDAINASAAFQAAAVTASVSSGNLILTSNNTVGTTLSLPSTTIVDSHVLATNQATYTAVNASDTLSGTLAFQQGATSASINLQAGTTLTQAVAAINASGSTFQIAGVTASLSGSGIVLTNTTATSQGAQATNTGTTLLDSQATAALTVPALGSSSGTNGQSILAFANLQKPTDDIVGTLKIAVGTSGAAISVQFQPGTTLSQAVSQINNNSQLKAAGITASAASSVLTLTGPTATGTAYQLSSAGTSLYDTPATPGPGVGTDFTSAALSTLTTGNAQNVLTGVNAAIANVSYQRGILGAYSNQLTAASNTAASENVNLTSAESSIRSTNYGQATSDLAKYEVLSQTGISALAQANSVQQEILKLLQ